MLVTQVTLLLGFLLSTYFRPSNQVAHKGAKYIQLNGESKTLKRASFHPLDEQAGSLK